MLFVTAVPTDKIITIAFEGDIDMFTVRSFYIYIKEYEYHKIIPFKEFEKEVIHKFDTIALDLSKVFYLDSSGIGLILGIIKQYRPLGKKVGVIAISEKAEDLFRLINVEHFIQL